MSDSGIKRILVALDTSETNRNALQTASLLASQLQAELQALFVEDINLLRLAELPFAHEMMIGSPERRRMTTASVERQMQAQVARLRQLVETTAQQNRIKVDFKVLRGQISNELQLAAQGMDLLILGKSSQHSQRSLKLGKVAQEVLTTVNCNILLLQYGALIERPVAVLFDGSTASQRALQLAVQLAHGDHNQLKVMYPAVAPQQQQALQQQVQALTRSLGIDADQIVLNNNSSETLLQTAEQFNSRVLIVTANHSVLNNETIKALVLQSHMPLIVMR